MVKKEKSLHERHFDEILTDNSNRVYCATCEGCRYADKRGYDRAMCEMYTIKPMDVIENKPCEFYEQ